MFILNTLASQKEDFLLMWMRLGQSNHQTLREEQSSLALLPLTESLVTRGLGVEWASIS